LKSSFDVEVGYKSTPALNEKENDVNPVMANFGAGLSVDVIGLGLN